jgi:serpin B
MKYIGVLLLLLFGVQSVLADDPAAAAMAVNQLGLQLEPTLATNQNLCLSPYAIQVGLGMVFEGTDKDTRRELARVLHYPDQSGGFAKSFAALQESLDAAKKKSAENVAQAAEGTPREELPEPISLELANRLFVQKDFSLRQSFVVRLDQAWHAGIEQLDFGADPGKARTRINAWVADKTQQRIANLVPEGQLSAHTCLTLIDAIYLKAPWAARFEHEKTRFAAFRVPGKARAIVPTMFRHSLFRYAKFTGMSVDEQGIEAAATVAAQHFVRDEPPTVSEVHVDHPFLFAVQDVATGVCLFMGRVVDPR